MKNENSIFHCLCLFLAVFTACGWYFAESENEVLRQELAAQSYAKPVHMEEIQHEH